MASTGYVSSQSTADVESRIVATTTAHQTATLQESNTHRESTVTDQEVSKYHHQGERHSMRDLMDYVVGLLLL